MLVKDLVLAHTAEEVYPIYFETYGILRLPDINDEERQIGFFAMYEKLKTIEPVISENTVLTYPITCVDLKLNETAYFKANAASWQFRRDILLDSLTPEGINEFSTEFLPTLISKAAVSLPDEYDITYLSWNQMLGFDIPDSNLRAVGEVQMLARLMLDMSHLGFTEKDIEAQRDEVTQEINKEKEPETNDDFDITDLLNSISLENISEKEKNTNIENDRPLYVETLSNLLAKYNAVKKACDRQH